MGFKLDRVHVWSGEVADRAGGVASKLALLAQAGANLEFIVTRRQPDRPGTGVLYVAPVTGPVQVRAAKAAGLAETPLRIPAVAVVVRPISERSRERLQDQQ